MDKDIQYKFDFGERQLFYYKKFYELINEYNFLLKINLPFSTITKKIKYIKEKINSNEELKKICKTKLPINDLSDNMDNMNIKK